MKVWVDQDVCTGDGLCEEMCPSVFTLRDGISYVIGPSDIVTVPEHLLDSVLDAAEECPGECIFLEP